LGGLAGVRKDIHKKKTGEGKARAFGPAVKALRHHREAGPFPGSTASHSRERKIVKAEIVGGRGASFFTKLVTGGVKGIWAEGGTVLTKGNDREEAEEPHRVSCLFCVRIAGKARGPKPRHHVKRGREEVSGSKWKIIQNIFRMNTSVMPSKVQGRDGESSENLERMSESAGVVYDRPTPAHVQRLKNFGKSREKEGKQFQRQRACG